MGSFFIIRCFLLLSFFLFTGAFGNNLWTRTEMVEMAGYGEQKLSSVVITGSLLCDTSRPHLHSIPIPGICFSTFFLHVSCLPSEYILTWSSQVPPLPSSATLDPKGGPNGLRLLLMNWESLKSIFPPNSMRFHTLKTLVSSSQYMCLGPIDAITPLPIYTNLSNLFPLPMVSVSTPQGKSGYRATVRDHSKLVETTFQPKDLNTNSWFFKFLHVKSIFFVMVLVCLAGAPVTEPS